MLFQEHSVRHLPVLDGDRLVGLLEKENLTELLTRQVQAFAQNPIAQTQNRLEIGDRQREDAKFWASEQRSQKLFDALPKISVQGYSRDRQVIYWNKASEKIYGYTADEAIGQKLDHLIIPPPMRQDVINLIDAWVNGGEPIPACELTLMAKDGSSVHVYSSHVLLNNPRNEPELYCIDIDLSDRKQSESALKQSEMTNRTIIETLPDLLIQMDIEGRYISMFAGSGVRVIYPSNEPNQPEVYNVLPADLVEQRLHYAKQAIATGIVQIYEQIFTFEDEQRYEEVRIAPLNDREVLIIIRDVTDVKQAEFERLQNAELIRATRLKDEFLATMSHELRTPLNAILGMSEVLIEQIFGDINEQQLKALQTIQDSGSHLLELINDILDVAKIESGQVELDCHPTAIVPLCKSSLAFIRQQAIAKHIQIKTHWQNNLPNVLVDERRMRQVLLNLLNNAVKFTADGGQITIEVNLTSQEKPLLEVRNYLQIAIADTGIGISPENIPKLFQPFIQIDSALNRKYQGTGLGLALVKRIVELHGGTVGLISEVGVGSCFTIVIPCTDVVTTSPERKNQIDISHEPSQAKHDNYFSILLAEDNEDNIEMISTYLEAKGYHLLFAKNGLEAIAMAKLHQPDLILMDIQMPIMDGLDATKQIRLDPNLVNTPIIALTALAMTGDRERCLAAGANDYIAKPVRLRTLSNTIQELLRSLK